MLIGRYYMLRAHTNLHFEKDSNLFKVERETWPLNANNDPLFHKAPTHLQ